MRTALLWALAALVLGSSARAQDLGGLAAQEKVRREREKEKEKEKKAKPAKVYTEEDLAIEAARAGPRSEAPPPGSPDPSPSVPANPRTAGEPGSEPEAGEDAPLRGRIAEAQAGLESARREAGAADGEVERLKQDLNPMSTTFKTDPNEILSLQAALTEAQAKAAEVRKQVGAAEAAMEAVRDEARRAGVRVP